MANPPHLFGADGRLDERVLQTGPWSVGVVDKIGPGPRSSYVEDFSLRILGLSAACTLSADEEGGEDEATIVINGAVAVPRPWPLSGGSSLCPHQRLRPGREPAPMPPDEGNE